MQTWALLVDSYRLLLSRKLFWITLGLSGLVVLLYASIGFDETGWYLFFGLTHFPSETIKAGSPLAKSFYLMIFSSYIVDWWFAFFATILALVSTASIYTDLMEPGAIDLIVAKPLSRARIFLVKYVGSLLFVVFQIGLFSLGVFLCVGFRVESWDWKIFLAIPVVVVFFSYLYAVHVFLSMVTRSTLASLLLAFVFWGGIAVVQWAEKGLAAMKVTTRVQAKYVMEGPGNEGFRSGPVVVRTKTSKTGSLTKTQKAAREAEQKKVEKQRRKKRRERMLETANEMETWQRRVQFALTVLPKTQDTLTLLAKWTLGDSIKEMNRTSTRSTRGPGRSNQSRQMEDMQNELQDEFINRSATYTIGTSLAFEAVILAFACFLFYRRDF
ncbi:MAG: ABC transporter permease [Planctomycetaceae bacterium]